MSTPLKMNKLPHKTKGDKYELLFSSNADEMGVPDNIPMPITTAESPNALVNFSRPNSFTRTIVRRALKNAGKNVTNCLKYESIFSHIEFFTNTISEDDAITNLKSVSVNNELLGTSMYIVHTCKLALSVPMNAEIIVIMPAHIDAQPTK